MLRRGVLGLVKRNSYFTLVGPRGFIVKGARLRNFLFYIVLHMSFGTFSLFGALQSQKFEADLFSHIAFIQKLIQSPVPYCLFPQCTTICKKMGSKLVRCRIWPETAHKMLSKKEGMPYLQKFCHNDFVEVFRGMINTKRNNGQVVLNFIRDLNKKAPLQIFLSCQSLP